MDTAVMANQILTKDELCALTGYRQAKRQKNVLDSKGIECIERRDGSLAVTWGAVNARLLGITPTSQRSTPNFSGFKQTD